jgi:hypothetical protein
VVGSIAVSVYIFWSVRPRGPAEETIDDAGLGRLFRPQRCVRRDKEASGLCFDGRPIRRAAMTLEGGHERLSSLVPVGGRLRVLISETAISYDEMEMEQAASVAGVSLTHLLDHGYNVFFGPCSVRGIVEHQEQLETFALGGCEQGRQPRVCGITKAHVDGEGIDMRGLREGNVQLVVGSRERCGIP